MLLLTINYDFLLFVLLNKFQGDSLNILMLSIFMDFLNTNTKSFFLFNQFISNHDD